MSFGFSAGDLVTVVQLAGKLRRRFIDSPDQFKAISDETKALSNVLRDVEDILYKRELTSRQAQELEGISCGCYGVLHDLDAAISKYQSLETHFVHTGLRAKSQRIWKRLSWEPEEIRELRSRLSSNVVLLNAFNASLSSKILQATNEGVDRLNRLYDDAGRQKLEHWLCSVDYAAQQRDSINRREEGTGLWLLESGAFHSWIDGERKTLFCPGIPGAGKTVITSVVVDFLSNEFQVCGNVGIVYLYCSYTRQKEQKFVDLMSCILLQLMRTQPECPRSVLDMCQRHMQKGTHPSSREIIDAVNSVVAEFTRIFIIIDALDECSNEERTRDKLLEEIFKIQETSSIAVFATSRSLPAIVNQFKGKSCTLLEIRASDQDVRRYLERHITLLPAFVSRNRSLQHSIEEEIAKSVDGMFLLAKLQLDSLTDKLTPKAMKAALQQLPRGSEALEEAYGLAMERIQLQKAGCAHLAGRVLAWLTFSKRQLTLPELRQALAVDRSVSILDEDNLLDADDIASVCAGLVVVDHDSNVVRLVHYTTLTYMECSFSSEAATCQADIAMTCLSYLSFDTFASGHCLTYEDLGIRLRKYPFLIYAARYWALHAYAAFKAPELEAAAIAFLENTRSLSCSVQALHILVSDSPGYRQGIPSNTSAVHLAAYLGFEWALTLLLQRGYPSDSLDSTGKTPLLYAAGNNHTEIVKLLLERDDVRVDFSNTKSPAQACGTPLSFASMCGHDVVVKMLMNHKNVSVNFKLTDGTTPLMSACTLGHETVVGLLLGHQNIELNAVNHMGRTALLLAISRGHDAVVKLLLEHKSIEADGKTNQNQDYPHDKHTTSTAEQLNHRSKVNVNCKDVWNYSPLALAASEGHEAIVRLLLKQDAIEADIRDDLGATPLSEAATRGYEGIVRLLIDREDVDADSRDDKGYTPLSWAVSSGHTQLIKTLVDREDIDANSSDNVGRTIISWAVCSTFAQKNAVEELVRILVERDDVRAGQKDDQGRTPLMYAAERKSSVLGEEAIAVVELLAKRGDVDVMSKDVEGLTAYDLAVQAGNDEIAKLLNDFQHSPPPYETITSNSVTGYVKDIPERPIGPPSNRLTQASTEETLRPIRM